MRPLLTAEEMRRHEADIFKGGRSSLEAMEQASQAVADVLIPMQPKHVVILCGPGNNGGDGYGLALLLHQEQIAVSLGALAPAATVDAQQMEKRWLDFGQVLSLDLALEQCPGADVVVDALFGTGLKRPLDLHLTQSIESAVHQVPIRLSVDIPSGVSADDGTILSNAFRATHTVTFGEKKRGHVLEPGKSQCGQIILRDIGLSYAGNRHCSSVQPDVFENSLPDLPQPEGDVHKYRRGHALIAGGGRYCSGAARLAARAALRIGAGVATLLVPKEAADIYATQITSIMLEPCEQNADYVRALSDDRARALLIGPGFGVGAHCRDLIADLRRCKKPLVLDADALTSFEGDPSRLFAMLDRDCVITPHQGEFARLFPDLEGSKLAQAQAAATRSQAIVVLKGSDTVIAHPDGYARINAHASPWLATAGSGDVLAGMICGLLAQGVDVFKAACAGVRIHGEIGMRLGSGLIAEDLVDAIVQFFCQKSN